MDGVFGLLSVFLPCFLQLWNAFQLVLNYWCDGSAWKLCVIGSMITCCHLSWNRLGCCRDSGWLLIRERKGVNGYVRADNTIMLWHKYHKYKHYKCIPRSLSEQGASAVQYGLTLWYKAHATRRMLKTISVYYALTCSVHNRTCLFWGTNLIQSF